MDVYETPKSDLIDDNNRPFKPIKGILIGLFYTIVLAMIVSILWLLAVGAILGFDLNSPNLESEMAGSLIYMTSDSIISAIILFFGGRAVGKRTPGKEMKYGIILTAMTIVIYLLLVIATESYKTSPIIYVLATFIITAIAVPYGSKSTTKT